MKIGLIGLGSWGKNYVRVLTRLVGNNQLVVCDINPNLRAEVLNSYPDLESTGNYLDLCRRPDIEGLVIATPPQTHFLLARAALYSGKHVLIEKPVAANSLEAESIFDLAAKKGLTAMTGHLMVYHPMARELGQIMKSGRLGRLQSIIFSRTNPQTGSGGANALWDLGVHDLALLEHWLGEELVAIKAGGMAQGDNDNWLALTVWMRLAGGTAVNLFVSSCHPVKTRQIVLIGEQGRLLFDDLKLTDKIAFYTDTQSLEGVPVEPLLSSVWSEPLEQECRHFLDCLAGPTKPLTGAEHTLWVMHAAEKIMAQLNDH